MFHCTTKVVHDKIYYSVVKTPAISDFNLWNN